jgi:hypothetical protein
MHSSSKVPTIAVLLALGASRAAAQEHGRVALDLGYPPAIIPIDRWSLTPTGRVSALLYF